MKPKNIIWSDYYLDIEDWRSELEETYPGLSEEELMRKMYEENNDNLDDERMNLDIQLSAPILVCCDLWLWNGRAGGYAIIQSGNIKDCLHSDCDYVTWYVDELGDLRCEAIHHDGTNRYLYRVFKPEASELQRENLIEKILRKTVTRADINRLTRRLGDYIGNVYGWSFPHRGRAA